MVLRNNNKNNNNNNNALFGKIGTKIKSGISEIKNLNFSGFT
jgi:hypothetical protein